MYIINLIPGAKVPIDVKLSPINETYSRTICFNYHISFGDQTTNLK